MPSISVPALVAGGLGAAGSIASAAIGSSAAKSAAQTQANAADQAAQTQLGIYNQTRSDLAPYLTTGNNALSQLAQILGLPSTGGGASPLAQVQGTTNIGGRTVTVGPTGPTNPTSGTTWINDSTGTPTLNVYDQSSGRYATWASPSQDVLNQWLGGSPISGVLGSVQNGVGAPSAGGSSSPLAANVMNLLQNYPGYQFQFNQGIQGLDRSAASRGLLLSGAQLKDAQTFGQGQAQSAFNSYLSSLSGLGGLGENAGAQTGNIGQATGANVGQAQLAAGQAGAAGTVGSANAIQSGLQGALNSALLGYGLSNQVGPLSQQPIVLSGSSPVSLSTPDLYSGALNTTLPNYTLSDARAKTDIRAIGKTHEGLTIYSFRYKSGGPKTMGVLAQEVEKVRPQAVREVGGLKVVDYDALSPLSRYLREAA